MGKRSFGTIRKMRSGRFQACYKVGEEIFYAPDTFETRSTASEWLATVRSSILRHEWINPNISGQRFKDYALAWFKERARDLRPKTRDLYAGLLDALLLPYLGDTPMKELSPLVVKQWRGKLLREFAERSERGDMPTRHSTGANRVAQAYRLLHTIMADAVRDEVVRHNPCVLKGASQVRAIERTPATLEQLDTIAANMPERYAALIHVAAWSGLRFSELAGLRRRDILLVLSEDNQVCYRLNVDKQTYKIRGKLYEDAAPKTDAGRRAVYLPAHLTDVLTSHMGRFTDSSEDAYVFPTAKGTPISNNVVGKCFRKAREIAGRPDLRFHDLRHTGATLAAKAGATTKELMQRMGHSSMRAAMIYQHANEEDDLLLAARMDAMAFGGAKQAQRMK